MLADGTLAFLGRNQAQVKINGQRVELLTYEIGGSSLALVTMLHHVNQTFDTQLTPNECPLTVELLARRVQALTSVAHGY